MIKKVLLAAALVAGSFGAAQAATIFSDDFNADTQGAPSSLLNWTVTQGSIDVIPVGGQFDWYDNGGNYVDLNGSTGAAGRIEHTLTGLNVGSWYSLVFDYGYNINSGSNEQLSFGVDSATGTLLASDFATVIPRAFNNYTFLFKALSTNATLFFADDDLSPGDNGGPIIDNVSVAAVPLPAGGLLLLGALGGVAALRRRKSV